MPSHFQPHTLVPLDCPLPAHSWSKVCGRTAAASPYGREPGWGLSGAIVKSGDDCRQELLALQLIQELQDIWTGVGGGSRVLAGRDVEHLGGWGSCTRLLLTRRTSGQVCGEQGVSHYLLAEMLMSIATQGGCKCHPGQVCPHALCRRRPWYTLFCDPLFLLSLPACFARPVPPPQRTHPPTINIKPPCSCWSAPVGATL